MTTTQLTKLLKAKQAADARRHASQREAIEDYRAWVVTERNDHMAMNAAELTHGIGSPHHKVARKAWLLTWERMPTCPPDSAWKT